MSVSKAAMDRLIFTYHDGSKKCAADPIELEFKLAEHGFDWSDMQKVAEANTKLEVLEAQLEKMEEDGEEIEAKVKEIQQAQIDFQRPFLKAVEAARKVFGLAPVSVDSKGKIRGTTSPEVMMVVNEYLQFQNDLKKTEDSNPTLSKLTKMRASSSPSKKTEEGPEFSATEQSASFGTTETELPPVTPMNLHEV